jgi:hypothetical protein
MGMPSFCLDSDGCLTLFYDAFMSNDLAALDGGFSARSR